MVRRANKLYRKRNAICRSVVQSIYKAKAKQKLPKKWWVRAFQKKGSRGAPSADVKAAAQAAQAIGRGEKQSKKGLTIEEQFAE